MQSLVKLIKIRFSAISSAHHNPFYYEWACYYATKMLSNVWVRGRVGVRISVWIKVQYWSINLDFVCTVNQASNKKLLQKCEWERERVCRERKIERKWDWIRANGPLNQIGQFNMQQSKSANSLDDERLNMFNSIFQTAPDSIALDYSDSSAL